MRFTIITNKPGHQPPQSSCDFYPPGGTIGRGTDNNLVLPDDERTISRLQAIVHISADGECRITNRGNVTRVVLNDIPLERGRQVELQDGDVLGIDEYRVQVSDLALNAQPVIAMAAPKPNVAPQAQPQAAQPAKAAQAQAQPSSPSNAGAQEPTAVPTEIWDSLMEEFSISDSISQGQSQSQTARPKAPEAQPFNPFNAPKEADRNPEDPLAHFTGGGNEPLFGNERVNPDSLFKDDTPFDKDSIFNDVTPTTLVPPSDNRQAAKPQAPHEENEEELDPLALFGGVGSTPVQSRSDDPLGLMMGGAVPLTPPDELSAGVAPLTPPPSATPDVEPVKPQTPPEKPQPEMTSPLAPNADDNLDLASLAGSPLFPEEVPEEPPVTRVEVQPEPPEVQDYAGITLPTPQTVARSTAQTPKGRLRIDPVQSPSQGGVPTASNGDVLNGELLEALLEGMGLGELQPTPQFDRDNMRQLGQMLSMFSQGTVALLSSRSILKRGVKADMTMVLDDANNPFKLLPSGKTVLMQMFGTRMPGFMPPKKSVRDALIDLQAHQLGMIAGIRAIIAAMLQSFNPEQLEEEARRDGVVSRLALPASRKAALWDYFVRHYSDTAGEIEDDFHTLFGEAFLHAYDMEVNQYKDSQSGSEEE
ncbi:type VI secretion system-associated FHA domain protein TagH [Cronobacter dublinensis]|uniref:type VI secretion system-associated FHA domain protein TagH n=1 Tax=Cronobacter dublinensis TaxID=413497 RepID=UPI000399E77C|nr:type VI secretion system-associated FHA domain protein TagH [Cronobacter dublinensis]MDI6442713.1 type VI secretion system-associated FHA domain protein TagH [Cronobacter dublinensis]NCH97730.1 type VI secretion system-associated FHA domain protein TagH [Cronobacter dublinensis]